MRLQEVLKDRENEIQVLEKTLKDSKSNEEIAASRNVETPVRENKPDDDEVSTPMNLSPKTMNQFKRIRQSMEIKAGQVNLSNGHTTHDSISSSPDRPPSSIGSETDESLERLNELML
jgi:hypothetical protein